MAKANPKEIDALYIRTKHNAAAYRRAGFVFNREGMGIPVDALDKDQVELLKADPHLVVEECTFPADEAEGDPAGNSSNDEPQVILLGSDAQPSHIVIGDAEAPLGDVVGIAFARACEDPEIPVIDAEGWNAEEFGQRREELIAEAVAALQADPQIYTAFLAEREAANAAKAAAKKSAAKKSGAKGKGRGR